MPSLQWLLRELTHGCIVVALLISMAISIASCINDCFRNLLSDFNFKNFRNSDLEKILRNDMTDRRLE